MEVVWSGGGQGFDQGMTEKQLCLGQKARRMVEVAMEGENAKKCIPRASP